MVLGLRLRVPDLRFGVNSSGFKVKSLGLFEEADRPHSGITTCLSTILATTAMILLRPPDARCILHQVPALEELFGFRV